MSLLPKLNQFRCLMAEQQIDGYFIPSADEHLNEYPPTAKLRRQWLSGFTGSAGDFLVTLQHAYLFVDSRYYEQADQQVDSSVVQVCKLELAGHKQPTEVLADLVEQNSQFRLGIDPFVFSIKQFREFSDELVGKGLEIVPISENLVDKLRQQIDTIPPFAQSEVFAVPDALAGKSFTDKLAQVREKMRSAGAELLPITKLDQIAWLLNLRGRDVPCNPVFIAYMILTLDQAFLFTNQERIPEAIKHNLADYVQLENYENYATKLVELADHHRVWLSDRHLTYGSYLLLKNANARFIEKDCPIELLKAAKNPTEIQQMQLANLKASVAKTRTIKWIDDQYAMGKPISETAVARTIEKFYAESEGFLELSFPTIAAIGTNSSIVHYGSLDPNQMAQAGDLLLLDSGCQFMGGTTDDTRTVVIGEPTDLQKMRYTAVLKAHINCAMTQFPKGANGSQLDGITRASLWAEKLDYGHGTGHGVGAFLNVHEGPNGISKRVQQTLELGMINSIEPGYYEPNWGGMRIENLYFVKEIEAGWYGFESLTYIPFARKLIVSDRLNAQEKAWLNHYYQQVQTKLSQFLLPEEQAWLREECALFD